MSESHLNFDCPCTSTACPRHGDCEACKANHLSMGQKNTCERLKCER